MMNTINSQSYIVATAVHAPSWLPIALLVFGLAQRYLGVLATLLSTCYAIVPIQILRGTSKPHPE